MSTLYEIFKVSEDASQDEIKMSFEKILKKADSMPQDEKIIEHVRRVKIAYGILSDPEKRKKYDMDLASKRANELIENVQTRKNETVSNVNEEDIDSDGNIILDKPRKEDEDDQYEPQNNVQQLQNQSEVDASETKRRNPSVYDLKAQADKKRLEQEQKRIEMQKKLQQMKKQQKKQDRINKKNQKKEAELKREMNMQAYGEYLQRQGYKVKYPWTWRRVKRLLMTIIALIIVGFIAWHIPPVRRNLLDLYENNFVIKMLVNIVISILSGIMNAIKSIFQK